MINTQLNALFTEWKHTMTLNGDCGFCYDGLVYRNDCEDALWNAAPRRYASFLRLQLDILNPNIIVCGGDIVFRVAREVLYDKVEFRKVNDWVYEVPSLGLFVINNYHLAAYKSNEVMYGGILKAVKKGITNLNI